MATVGVVATLFAADTMAQQDCRSIEDNAARLACYDSLALPPKPVEAPPPAKPVEASPPATPIEAPVPMEAAEPEKMPQVAPPAAVPAEEKVPAMAAPAATETPVPLDDEIGKEALGRDEEKELVVHGTVVRCVEDATSKYLFYFDNGQIWKQKDNTKIRWKECAFDVTITKDFFGYKMIRVGETRKVRVGRVK
jgi:hypothetical protein